MVLKKGALVALFVLFLIILSANSFAAVLINEFLPNSVNTDYEWIELFNNGTSSINLLNFNISEEAANKNFTIGNVVIGANEFVVLVRNEIIFNQTYKPSGFIVIEYGPAVPSLNLNDGDDSIFLYNSSGNLINSILKYANPGENISIGRYPDGAPNIFNLITLTPGKKNDNKAPTLNKWLNVTRNNSQIGGIVNITVNLTDDTTQVNSSIVNFNGANFSMTKDGDLWWFRLSTTPYEQKQYNITVFFNDSYGKSGFDTLLNIAVNNSPFITGFSPTSLNQILPENSTLNFSVNASDPDDAVLNYFWFINNSLASTNPLTFAYTPDFNESGIRAVNATVRDSALNQISMAWIVRVSNVNRAPVLDPISNKVVSKNTNLSFNITAVDFDNDTVTFSLNHSRISLSKINNSLATVSWRPTNIDLGDNVINFTVSDGFLTDSKIVIISVNGIGNTPPTITSLPKTDGEVNERYIYDAEANDIDNDTLVFSLKANLSGVSIDSSTGAISFVPSLSGLFAVNVSVTDFTDIATQSFNLSIKEEIGLKIIDVDAKVDGRKSSNLVNKGKIRKESKPNSKVELKVTVKNVFSKNANLEINDVKVKAAIEGIDDGDDIEEESREFDLKAQDGKTVTLRFNIPVNADEGDFDVSIEAEGEDENNVERNARFDTELEIEKEKDDLRFLSFDLSPSTINCVRVINIKYKIINVGEEDEENSFLEIKNDDSGLDFSEKNIKIISEIGSNIIQKSLRFKINNSIEQGTYQIIANIYTADNVLRDTKKVDLKVIDCIEKTKEEEVVLLLGQQEQPKQQKKTEAVKQPIETPTIKISFKEADSNLRLLVLSTFAFTSFFVFTAIILFARFY
ncbi:lamin tail domain-containing protein [Candidatus Woesearchaeota archaeon]|nr:lamin tail domain-containing protein [Candidatus Woesearchaeota archaeon]